MTNLQNTVKRLKIIVLRKYFAADHQCDVLEPYYEIRAKPHCGQKYGQFLKHCHRPFIHCFPLVYLCVSCKQHFGDLTVKFLPNQITTYKMASLENIVTSLRIIVLCNSYRAYNQNDTLEFLPWNCHLTPLWRKRWSICKILSTPLNYRFYLVIWCLSSKHYFGAVCLKF